VKNRILTFFLLFAGICYLNSVLEFDQEESKANFKQEQQVKVALEKTITSHNAGVCLAMITLIFSFFNFALIERANILSLSHLSRYFPPEQLFLKNSVFRI